MESKYEQAFKKAGWTDLEEYDREWWVDSLLRKLPSEDPVRLLKAVAATENNSKYYFDRVDGDCSLCFNRPDSFLTLAFGSLEELECYVRWNFPEADS